MSRSNRILAALTLAVMAYVIKHKPKPKMWQVLTNIFARKGNRENVSKCCGAPVEVAGRTTLYYVCTMCGQPCDVR